MARLLIATLFCVLHVGCTIEGIDSAGGVPILEHMQCPPPGDYCMVIAEVIDDSCDAPRRVGNWFCERLHKGVVCSARVHFGSANGSMDFDSGLLYRDGCAYWADVYYRNPEGGPDKSRPFEWER